MRIRGFRIIKEILFGLVLILISVFHSFGQGGLSVSKQLNQFNYDHWTNDDGLPDNAIIYSVQAKDGYMWFASYGGITRFNGVEFYTFNSFNTPQIINNSFTHIYEDRQGFIWASSSGNGVATVKDNKVRMYTTDDGLPSNFSEEVVQDQDGRIWVATSQGLSYRDNGIFVNDEVPESLRTVSLKSIDCDEKNHMWVATIDQGVYEFYKGKIVNHYTAKNGLQSNNINFIIAKRGHVWIGSDSGLNTIVNGRIIGSTVEDGLPNNMVTACLMDSRDRLWIGTYHGFCRQGINQIQYLTETHPLYGRDITSLVEDDEGNLWVTTYRGGLFKFWEGKFTNYSNYELGVDRPFTVHTIYRDKDDFIVVNEDGVQILNKEQATLLSFDPKIDQLASKFKHGLVDSKGRHWFGTSSGVLIYDYGQIKIITTDDGLVNNNVRTIIEDSQGRFWVGTFYGLSLLNSEGNVISNFTTQNGLSHEYIMHVMQDSKNNIWIGTKAGLNLYKDGSFEVFNSENGMAGDFVFKTFEDSDGTIWIGSNAGLTRYKNEEFKKITIADGLVSNTIFQVIEDDYGYYWFPTNQQKITVFKVSKKDLNEFCDGTKQKLTSIEYSEKDGLMSTASTSSASSFKDEDGTLWFATQNGIESIDPKNIKINTRIPPVVIENIRVNDKDLDVVEKVVVPSGKQRITFKFVGLSYVAPSEMKYKYMLEGYDDDWIQVHNIFETSYTNLAPDDYTFHVIAANSDGVWNEEGASISFRVNPAFYETTWFYLLCIVIILGLVWIVYTLRIRSLTNARLELENLVNIRTHEIEAQKEEIESQRTKIEEHNEELTKVNLSLEDKVKDRTDELKKTYGELLDANKELDTFIYRSVHDVRGPIARLQGLCNLLEMETSDPNVIDLVGKLKFTSDEMNNVFYRLLNIVRLKSANLNHTKVDLDELIKDVLDRFRYNSTANDLTTNVNIVKGTVIESSKETIDLILNQLIDNAIKFKKTDQPALVDIDIKKVEDRLSIKVSDHGVGIPEKLSGKIFDMFFVGQEEVKGAGLGLYTVKTAVKVLKGNIKLISNASKDKVTCFEVELHDR